VPAHEALGAVEAELRDAPEPESALRAVLSTVGGGRTWARRFADYGAQSYDLAVIDTPPSLGLLTIAAMVAADGLLIPAIPEILSFDTLRLFFENVQRVRRRWNPRLQVLGVLPTFYDRRLLHHNAVLELMRVQGYPVLDITIGRSIRVAEAAAAEQSIITYAPDNQRALEYLVLGRVVSGWLNHR